MRVFRFEWCCATGPFYVMLRRGAFRARRSADAFACSAFQRFLESEEYGICIPSVDRFLMTVSCVRGRPQLRHRAFCSCIVFAACMRQMMRLQDVIDGANMPQFIAAMWALARACYHVMRAC
jgi:hypothetical protein